MICEQLLTQTDHNLKGNSIKLPHTYLEKIIKHKCEPPYFFRITTEFSTTVITSVLEFTAESSTVTITEETLDNLGIDGNHIVFVDLYTDKIDKGKIIRVTPLEREFFKIPDYDAILESKLSKHNILYDGQKIHLDIFDKYYNIVVDNFKTEKNSQDIINITNIDLNVDINNIFLEEEAALKQEALKQEALEQEALEKEALEKEKADERRQEEELKDLKAKFLARFT